MSMAAVKWAWSISSLPELKHLSEKARRALVKRSVPRFFGFRLWGRSLIGGFLFGLVASSLLGIVLGERSVFLTPAIIGVCTLAVYQWEILRIRSALRLHLKQTYKGRRIPICMACGYDTSNVSQDRCPECGASLRVPGR
jgi:hypothetical protein